MTHTKLFCLSILCMFHYCEPQQPGASCSAPIGGCLGGTMCQHPNVCVEDGPHCCAPDNIVSLPTTTTGLIMPQPTQPTPSPESTVTPSTTSEPPLTTTFPPPPVVTTTKQDKTTTAPTTAPPTTAPVTVPPPVVTTTIRIATTAAAACVDLLNPNTGVSDCPKMTMYCTNMNYFSLMVQQCPRSCGYCSGFATTPSANTCVDLINPNTGVSDCPSMAAFCTNANYYTLMSNQCPKTCGRCGGPGGVATTTTASTSTCVDLINPYKGVSDCPAMAAYCNNANYLSLMKNQCPKTCGFCTTATAPSACADLLNPTTGVSDCPQMISYCTNPNYSSLMRQQCAKSCGYCTSG